LLGVVRNTRHRRGDAAVLRSQSRSVSNVFAAGRSWNAGGVGRYSRSNFVDMDCGPVRTWVG